MADAKPNIVYTLAPNTLEEGRGYHGVVTHVGTTPAETFYERAAKKTVGLDASTVRTAMEAALATVADVLADRQYRVVLEDVTFELELQGSTDSVNGSPSGGVQVAIRPSASLRNAAYGLSPAYGGTDGPRTEIVRVETVGPNEVGVIAGTEPFKLTGFNLTASGEDESLVVTAADGTEAVAAVDEEHFAGTTMKVHLAAALPPGRGKVVLTTHGKLTPEAELVQRVKSVTIVAGATPEPTPPTPIWQSGDRLVKVMSVSDAETGDTFTWGNTWSVVGEGFTGTEPGWFVEIAMLSTAPGANPVNLDFDVKSATEIELTPGAGAELDAGEYPNATITFGIAHDSDEGLVTETAEIPVRLVVSG